MDIGNFIAFSIIPILSPGPSTCLLTYNTYMYGAKMASRYLIADELGTFIMILITLLIFREVLVRYPDVFFAVKVIGSVYVIVLGIICFRVNSSRSLSSPVFVSRYPFLLTFLFGLTNPKTVIFFIFLSDYLIFAPQVHALLYVLQKYFSLLLLSFLLIIAREHVVRQRKLALNVAALALLGFGVYAFADATLLGSSEFNFPTMLKYADPLVRVFP